MSKPTAAPDAVVEWGPSQSTVLNLMSRDRKFGNSLAEASTVLNGHRNVVGAISRRATFIRQIRVPDAPREEVAKILDLKLDDLFPVPGSELAYDFLLTDDRNLDGRLAIVIAVRESDLNQFHDEAKTQGLKVSQVLPVALGSEEIARQKGMLNCAFVERSAEGLAIDLIQGGRLCYSRVAPSGPGTDVEAEVARTFAAAGIERGPIIATEGLQIDGLPGATTTLEALAKARTTIDLEPRAVIESREKSRTSGRVRLSGLLVAGAALVAAFVGLERFDAMSAIQKDEAKEKKAYTSAKTIRDGMKKKLERSKAVQIAVDRGFRPAQRLTEVLSVVTQVTPSDCWLTAITLERGRIMNLRGTSMSSQSVAAFVQALADNKRFRDAKLTFANNGKIGDKAVVEFAVSAIPVGNIPLVEKTKGGTKK
ncbi:MAG: PilN domain-containing protein [Armatimonadetes bacterium]|nr:PilN domain-containing protein [Armatimonadota bacterium]